MRLSLVLLNWQRPANVRRIIEHYRDFATFDPPLGRLIDDITVFNNHPQPFDHPQARVINASCDTGLYSRFAAAALARHEHVLLHDDDLLLPAPSLAQLAGHYLAAPDVLHGVFGRVPRPDGSYALDVNRCGRHTGDSTEVPIVLTRVLLTSRANAIAALAWLEPLRPLLDAAQPPGNGEDICLSFAAMFTSGKLNRVHPLDVRELPAPHAIHGRPGHGAHRTTVLRACRSQLADRCPQHVALPGLYPERPVG